MFALHYSVDLNELNDDDMDISMDIHRKYVDIDRDMDTSYLAPFPRYRGLLIGQIFVVHRGRLCFRKFALVRGNY